jgi:GNAT superfamily N-acetyltransferase
MGDEGEHPARSWASWRAFHADEADAAYDGDFAWFGHLQEAPLYRRDLDVVAATEGGELAAFCTLWYDDATRSAVCVLVGTAAEHQRRGLGKAVMHEGFRRLQRMGGTRAFATAYDAPAGALYGSMMDAYDLAETWHKVVG